MCVCVRWVGRQGDEDNGKVIDQNARVPYRRLQPSAPLPAFLKGGPVDGRPSWMRFSRECWDGDELLLYFFPYNDDDDDSVFFSSSGSQWELEREKRQTLFIDPAAAPCCVCANTREREKGIRRSIPPVVVVVDSQLFSFHITLRSWFCREAPHFQFCLSLYIPNRMTLAE